MTSRAYIVRPACVPPAALCGMLLVMQPVLNRDLMRRSAMIISGRKSPASSGSKSQPGTSWPSARALRGERLVEGIDVDLGTFEQRPGIVLVVGRVDLADQGLGQAALALIARKGLEGEEVNTPPKSKIIALIIARSYPATPEQRNKSCLTGGREFLLTMSIDAIVLPYIKMQVLVHRHDDTSI